MAVNVGPARHAQCGVSSTVGQALADLNLDKIFQVFKFRATATDANQSVHHAVAQCKF